jgi:hypothetical protein
LVDGEAVGEGSASRMSSRDVSEEERKRRKKVLKKKGTP